MNERIKKLRMELCLTQQKFANKIGINRNNIATYETGRNIPSDAVITLICRTFNINERWLRTGEGEMRLPEQEKNLLEDPSLTAVDRAMLQTFIDAPSTIRAAIRTMVLDAAERIRIAEGKDITPYKPEPVYTQEELAIYEKIKTIKEGRASTKSKTEEMPSADAVTDAAMEKLSPDEKEMLEQYRHEKNIQSTPASYFAASLRERNPLTGNEYPPLDKPTLARDVTG